MSFHLCWLHITEFHLQQGDAADVSEATIRNLCFNFKVVWTEVL